MPNRDPSIAQYAAMPAEVRRRLALKDSEAARVMALGDLVILSTQEGYRLLEQRVESDLAKVLGMQAAIGASNDADQDWRENVELLRLKIDVPVYAEAYVRSRRELDRTVVYAEELGERLGFGHLFHATIIYPDRPEPSQRSYALLGPNEVSYGDRYYLDPTTGEKFMAVSYMSQLGQAVWGASVGDVAASPLTFTVPNGNELARIVAIEVLGQAA